MRIEDFIITAKQSAALLLIIIGTVMLAYGLYSAALMAATG